MRPVRRIQRQGASIVALAARLCAVLLLVLCGFSGASASAQAAAPTAAAQCGALRRLDLTGLQDASTQITAAVAVETAGALPAYCRVQGYVASQVGFELRMPIENWNGKFLETGCGGWCGGIDIGACDAPLAKGYACIATDTGHKGGDDAALWAQGNLQARIDFGYRAIHVVRLAGAELVGRYYGRPPARSYFVGVSTGGFQGLIAAQRFPWDFDGIISGAPDMNEWNWAVHMLWAVRSFTDATGKPRLNRQELTTLHGAVLAQCDMTDGVRDGIVGDPLACAVDPARLLCKAQKSDTCLTRDQIDAVMQVYAGPPLWRAQRRMPDVMPGSELDWGQVFLPGSLAAVDGLIRRMVPNISMNASWTLADFDFDKDTRRAGLAMLYDNTNPDLRQFQSAGGKLLVYQGMADTVEVPGAVIDYYEAVERVIGSRGATQDFMRLFLVPGMLHGAGGKGAWMIDYLAALEDWVERGNPPAVLKGAHPDATGKVQFTRPVYPYPLVARYKGSGDPDAAANFQPVASAAGGRPRR